MCGADIGTPGARCIGGGGGGGGRYVEGLTWKVCNTPETLIELFDMGRHNLRYAETHMNKHSSRSHAVMQVGL